MVRVRRQRVSVRASVVPCCHACNTLSLCVELIQPVALHSFRKLHHEQRKTILRGYVCMKHTASVVTNNCFVVKGKCMCGYLN